MALSRGARIVLILAAIIVIGAGIKLAAPLLVPVLVASLDFFLAMAMGKDIYDFQNGEAANASVTIFLLAINCLLVGGFSQMREFVKEADVYKRERLVNLKIFPKELLIYMD